MQCDLDKRCRAHPDKDKTKVLYREQRRVVIGIRISESSKKLTASLSKPCAIGCDKHPTAGPCHLLVDQRRSEAVPLRVANLGVTVGKPNAWLV